VDGSGGLFSSPEKRSVVLCLLLVVATLALYNPASRHPFVNYDDDRYVVLNSHVRAGLVWSTIAWSFTSTEQANWHPLTWLSHALDCQLFHLNPAGHHYSNVLLHALNAVLLFLMLEWTTGSTGRSLMVAALFALHPINVESVAWIAERKNLLSMLFFLVALWSYGWYARHPGRGRYGMVALSFALGLMAKPQVITLPFVLLLWDYWPLGRMFPTRGAKGPPHEKVQPAVPPSSFSWLLLEKIPLFGLAAASAWITMAAQKAGGAVRTVVEYSLPVRLENAIVCYARYVGKAFWPSRLAPLYPHPGDSLTAWQVGGASLFLLAVTLLVVAGRGQRYLAVGWCWFLGTLLPMIGLVQVGEAAMADRYAYLSFVGLFVMVAWGASDGLEHLHLARRWLAVPALAACLALAAVAERQLGYWSDNVTLWSHTVQVTGDNFVAQDNWGGALALAGNLDGAMPHFRAAAKINPRDPVSHLNIAAYEQEHGNLQKAVSLYQTVLGLTSDAALLANTYANLGSAYRSLRDPGEARRNYERALRLTPESVPAWTGLGLLALEDLDFAQAADRFTHATAIQPSALGYVLLARALEKGGHPAEAQAADQAARQISPDLTEVRQTADRLLAP
jgi:Flp pilus assembly protein TadD